MFSLRINYRFNFHVFYIGIFALHFIKLFLFLFQIENYGYFMIERFYSIRQLTTRQLRELYTTYIPHGWIDAEFYKLMPEGVKPPELSDGEIIMNIDAGHEYNYFVMMVDCEGEEDGIMIGLGMMCYPDFAVYLHLPLSLLNELVQKYGLKAKEEAKNYTLNEFLIDEHLRNSMN